MIAFLLRTILRKLDPGGLAYFQVPTYRKGAQFVVEQYLNDPSLSGKMEMHILPQEIIWQIADETGCRVLDVREDGWTGSSPDYVSNSILLMKRQ